MIKNKTKIVDKIRSSRFFGVLRAVLQKIVLPGFDGMPLYYVIKFFIKGLIDGSLTTRASSVAFKFFLAIFPAIIFVFTLIPYIPIENFQQTLLETIRTAVPESIHELINDTITDIVSRQHGGLLSFGFIAALYFSSNGILGVINAFNSTAHNIETRSWWQQYAISVLLMLILTFIVITSITLMLLGTKGLQLLLSANIIQENILFYFLKFIKWLIIFLMIFFAVSFLYYLGPSKKENFRFISAGSTLATLLFVLTTLGFKFYVNNFSNYNALYGSIGTIILFLMWLYVNSIALLIGFELNVSISQAKRKIQIHN